MKLNLMLVPSRIRHTYFEGEDGDSTATLEADPSIDASEPDTKGSKEPETKTEDKTFSQDELNNILAKEKGKNQASLQKLSAQLETFSKNKGANETQVQELQKSITELEEKNMTEKQISERKLKKSKEEFEQKLTEETEGRKKWETLYATEKIYSEIRNEAKVAEAWNPEQFVNQLKGNSRLVEITDETTGLGTGKYETRIKFNDVDSDNKPIVADYSVKATVERMKELTDTYGNLFKSSNKQGVGGTNTAPLTGTSTDYSSMEAYIKNRDKFIG